MIHSILDTDLYKFTTSYAYIKLFPYAKGTFSFTDRDDTVYTDAFLEQLKASIDHLSQVALTPEELEYMTSHCRFLPRVYWEWLSSFRFHPERVDIRLDKNHHLHIEVTDYLYKATLYEVPLLAIVSEILNESLGRIADPDLVIRHLERKVELSNANRLFFSEFGTRRRFSFEVQDKVNGYLKAFLSNLSRKQAKLFDGVRCDSGDEFEFTDRLIERYREFGIDPTTKTIIFSNALDFEKALDIQKHCEGRIRCSFGIGTNLTNDTGYKPLNIVMKLTRCKMTHNQEWRECIKLSDDMGKHLGSLAEVQACLYELHLMDN